MSLYFRAKNEADNEVLDVSCGSRHTVCLSKVTFLVLSLYRTFCTWTFYKSITEHLISITLTQTKTITASDFRAMSSGHLAGTSMASWALGTRRAETRLRRWFSRPKLKAGRLRCSGVVTGALQSSQNKIQQMNILCAKQISHILYRALNVITHFFQQHSPWWV